MQSSAINQTIKNYDWSTSSLTTRSAISASCEDFEAFHQKLNAQREVEGRAFKGIPLIRSEFASDIHLDQQNSMEFDSNDTQLGEEDIECMQLEIVIEDESIAHSDNENQTDQTIEDNTEEILQNPIIKKYSDMFKSKMLPLLEDSNSDDEEELTDQSRDSSELLKMNNKDDLCFSPAMLLQLPQEKTYTRNLFNKCSKYKRSHKYSLHSYEKQVADLRTHNEELKESFEMHRQRLLKKRSENTKLHEKKQSKLATEYVRLGECIELYEQVEREGRETLLKSIYTSDQLEFLENGNRQNIIWDQTTVEKAQSLREISEEAYEYFLNAYQYPFPTFKS